MSRQRYIESDRYDRYAAHNEQSTLHKMKETYWTTKQAVYRKLGKKQDAHIVASDAELDAKLEVFKAIQKSCMDLLRAIEMYQDRLCGLSQEENAMGRFLKSESQCDKTRAGKMMGAVGKAQSFSSQQRLALRVPLVRLYQEVETFRYRAISDTLITINRMEAARTEYRGALMWMKDISEELDPDTYKQLEKFRKVQAQVKKTKAKFDKLKLDSMQKIDLLAASRCNMFSHVLANYQSTLLHFWAKTSRTMSAVAESFKGYQYYEFNMLKELAETSKKLADETGNREVPERDTDSQGREGLIDFDEEQKDGGSMTNLLQAVDKEIEKGAKRPEGASDDPFIEFEDEDNERTIDEIRQKQDAEFDITAKLFKAAEEKKKQQKQQKNQSGGGAEEPEEVDQDDMALLNEILNMPSAPSDDDFSKEWQAVFGPTPMSTNSNLMAGESDQPGNEFLPSSLLDLPQQAAGLSLGAPGLGGMAPGMTAGMPGQPPSQPAQPGGQPSRAAAAAAASAAAAAKKPKTDMSAWFNLFADLDPLADPDAIGRKPEEKSDSCL